MASVETISVGDELLLGIRDNSNLTFLGGEISRHGMSLRRNWEVRDEIAEIQETFLTAWKGADVVILTGGLGPTTDDLTREAVSGALGLELVYDEEVADCIRTRLNRLGRSADGNNFRQAYRLEGSLALVNQFGTAPGIYLRHQGKVLVLLPGPGSELKPMFQNEVLPLLTADGLATKSDAYLQLRSFGLGESQVAELLEPVFAPCAGRLRVAYCAHAGIVDIRLSAGDASTTLEEVEAIGRKARKILGEDFFATGHICLAKLVSERLRVLEKTLSVAESCTGGLLANAFTDIPGASKVFAGGLVCYNNDVKVEMLGVPEPILRQHGAVSAECAVAMATGAAERFSTDYALAVTGFAGPGGGTTENPVGTIYLGYCSPAGAWSRKVVYPGNRLAVKERAANTALDWMRRKVSRYLVQDILLGMPDEAVPEGSRA